MKTSAEWYEMVTERFPKFQILDADGWDRSNFDYSWDKEQITADEFSLRVCYSTCVSSLSVSEFINQLIAMEQKSLSNTSIADVQATTSDVIVYGNGDLFQLICKASSKSQGWMKSTKAMEIPAPSAGHRPKGCVVQTTSEFRNALGEVTVATDSICFVPYVQIMVDEQGNKYLGESYAK